MAGRRTKLTPEVQQTIITYIRLGAFAWVAAQAVGISPHTFFRWLRMGEKKDAREPYRTFCTEVRRAQAEARLKAEIEVRKSQPFNWLRYGPGRERPGEPGWTDSKEITGAEGGPIRVVFVEDEHWRGGDHVSPTADA